MADTTTPTTSAPATTSPPTEQKRKMFIPLENNPQVMTTLLHTLGLSTTLSLHDVFSLSDPSLLAFVPRPASALLLVFPVSEVYEKYRREEDEGVQEYAGRGGKEEVTWFRQTIGNSCGLMALLHAAGNGSAREFVGQYPFPLFPSSIPAPGDSVLDCRYYYCMRTRKLTPPRPGLDPRTTTERRHTPPPQRTRRAPLQLPRPRSRAPRLRAAGRHCRAPRGRYRGAALCGVCGCEWEAVGAGWEEEGADL